MNTKQARAEQMHAEADRLSSMEPRHRGTEAGKFLLDRIEKLRVKAYALEEAGEIA